MTAVDFARLESIQKQEYRYIKSLHGRLITPTRFTLIEVRAPSQYLTLLSFLANIFHITWAVLRYYEMFITQWQRQSPFGPTLS